MPLSFQEAVIGQLPLSSRAGDLLVGEVEVLAQDDRPVAPVANLPEVLARFGQRVRQGAT